MIRKRTIPFLAGRFAIVDEMSVIPGAAERGAFADTLPRLHWDTASAFSDPVLHMLRSVTGLGNVVFGTDYPYPRDAISIAGLRHLETTAELDDGERRDVLGGSAARLIPRLARRSRTAPGAARFRSEHPLCGNPRRSNAPHCRHRRGWRGDAAPAPDEVGSRPPDRARRHRRRLAAPIGVRLC